LGLNFFGLTPKLAPKLRKNLFTQIHEIVFHGKGGYDWNTVYNMPIWLRNYTFSLINEHYEKEKKAYEDAKKTKGNSKTLVGSDGKISPKSLAKNLPKSFNKSSYK
jgi:hypothetical protein